MTSNQNIPNTHLGPTAAGLRAILQQPENQPQLHDSQLQAHSQLQLQSQLQSKTQPQPPLQPQSQSQLHIQQSQAQQHHQQQQQQPQQPNTQSQIAPQTSNTSSVRTSFMPHLIYHNNLLLLIRIQHQLPHQLQLNKPLRAHLIKGLLHQKMFLIYHY